jgi:two-component system, LytTR family, sensor kinase
MKKSTGYAPYLFVTMTDVLHHKHSLSNAEKYLPYIYPVFMPILTLFAYKIPVHSLQEALKYWLFTGFLQFMMFWVVKKAVYSTAYYQVIRWLIAAFVCFSLIVFYLFLEYNFVHFTEGFANPNPWIPTVRYSINIPIFIALLESFKSFNERSRFNADNISLQNENTKAQFNQLLQQINPHFLFNSLTTLQAMMRSKDARTEEFIIKLKDVYQQTLRKEKGTVTLKEELEFFNAYMYLMRLRQEEAIFLEIQVSDDALAYHLPTFTLQLLAENCIKHNIVSKAEPLYIRLYQKDAKSLTISNNYQPKPIKSESFGIGLDNLKKRYSLAGIEQGVAIKQEGTIYETTIKLL